MVCDRGHSFDIARSGYINLLQPQDKRSKEPGDSAEAAAARGRLHSRSVTEPLAHATAETVGATSADNILDVGCGDGYYLVYIAERSGANCSGVDLSVPAIDAAARRNNSCHWVVANADRFVPWTDRSFSLVLSITGRMNPAEFHRVIEPGGRLLVAVPSPEDLIELRGVGRDRVDRTVADFADFFSLRDHRKVATSADLDAAGVEDVLLSIYRPLRKEPANAMRLTFSLDLLLFAPLPTPRNER